MATTTVIKVDDALFSFSCDCEYWSETKEPYVVTAVFLVNNGTPVCEFCGEDAQLHDEAVIKVE